MLTQIFFDGFRVKDFFVHRTAGSLIAPFVTLICVLLAGVGSARAANTAQVEVGFVGVPPTNFQNVLLNVQSVRINRNAAVGPANGGWETIPVPPGIGNSPQNADLQIDLNTSQNLPQLFNTADVRPDTYEIAEVQLDPNNPGTLIPDCPLAPPLSATADGCINYPIQLAAGTNVISVSNTGPGGLIAPEKGKLVELFLQVSMMINKAPTTAGGAYTVTIKLASPPTNPVQLGTVTGSVSGSPTAPTTRVQPLAVTAEAIGTNTPIATAPVQNGKFNLALPAAGGPTGAYGFGTLYDLALVGGADTYQAARLPPLYPGQSLSQNFTPRGGQTLGNITGTISDNCVATKPVVGATLQLLIPPDDITPTPPATPATFCIDSPEQCIAVATANTDDAGNFPLPGTLAIPAAFDNVPVLPKKAAYAMEITAPGYDPLFVQAIPSSGKTGGTCTTSATGATFDACDLALNTGYISGTIPITPPNPGQTTLVQVFAEDHGTNNIESALPMPLAVTNSHVGSCPGPPPHSCVSFTLNVPTSDVVPSGFDLFATTIDLYQGVTDPFQGHTIAVLADVPASAKPSAPGVCSPPTTATFPVDQTIDCVGHGSVTGGPSGVANADLGTSVVLSKDNVLITNTPVQNVTTENPNNSYAFCAPADTYNLQRLQLPVPTFSVVPSSAPTPVLDTNTVTVTIPPPPPAGGPSSAPTPGIKCPTTCEYPDGTCPGICNDVIKPIPE
jgi:hypothetical protein